MGTLILLYKIKTLIFTIGFKIASLFSNVVVKKKKKRFNPLKLIFQIISLILVPVILIALVSSESPLEEEKKKNYRLDDDSIDENIDAIKKGEIGEEAYWQSEAGNYLNGNSKDENKVKGAYIADKNFIRKFDTSKLTDMQIKRLREYVSICEEAASSQGVEPWVIVAVNVMEKISLVELGDSGIYVGGGQFDEKGGKPYGSVHPVTQREVNYTNYGQSEVSVDGTYDTRDYKGPFQLSSGFADIDRYNFKAAANRAVKYVESNHTDMVKYFEGITNDEDFLWAAAIMSFNTGSGGFRSHVPKVARKHFYESTQYIQTRPNYLDVCEKMFLHGDQKSNMSEMFKLYDGFEGISYAKEMVSDFNIQGITSPLYNPTGERIKTTPGKTNGEYGGDGGGVTDPGLGYKIYVYGDKRGCVIGNTDDGKHTYGWELDYEVGRYMFGALTKGKYMYNTCKAALDEIDGNGSGGGSQSYKRILFPTEEDKEYDNTVSPLSNNISKFTQLSNSLYYYWKDDSLLNTLAEDVNSPIYGPFDEVGYKGTFPIFIQGGGNEVSKTPWKYGGGSTNLGESGCSLFTLASLIHGTGFGTIPFANQSSGVDGLNDNGFICLQELAKALPNGPIVAEDVSALGYIVKTVPTTDEGLEELYSYLKKGVPFAVNVRYGDIVGYDKYYNEHTVHFTNSGHFLLLVGAFELNNKRYVEVVQSTYSNGGRAEADQNGLIFDFDELKDKRIIRSGSGYCVPAYTITGVQGVDMTPNYTKNGYQAPTRVSLDQNVGFIENSTVQTDISYTTLISGIKDDGIIRLPKDLYVHIDKDYVDVYLTNDAYVRISNFTVSELISDDQVYQEGTYIGTTSDKTVYEYYIGDALIPK